MYTSDIFTLLKSFSKRDLKSFRNFLLSPYFSKNKRQANLLEILIRYDLLNSYEKSCGEFIYRKLYPQKKYKSSTMRDIFSDLGKSLNDFIAFENFKKDPHEKLNRLLNEYLNKNLNGLNELKKFSGLKRKRGKADFRFFLKSHFTESHKFNFSVTAGNLLKPGNVQNEINFLDNAAKNLFLFYFTQLSIFYNNSLIMKRNFKIYNEPKILNFLTESTILNNLSEKLLNSDEFHFISELYINLLNMNNHPEKPEYYYRYRDSVNTHAGKLSADEISVHISNLVSYCTGKSLKGYTEFHEEYFQLIELIIKKKYYKDSKTSHLGYDYFRNFFLHGLRLKKYDWVKKFILNNYRKVNPNEKENMKNLGLAHLNFNQKNFNTSLDYIRKINTDQFIYKFEARNLTVRLFYELGYTEETLSLIKSYKEYIRKDKMLNTETGKRYINFLKVLEKLTLYKAGSENIDIGFIKHRLETRSDISFKPWLQEKIIQNESAYKKTA